MRGNASVERDLDHPYGYYDPNLGRYTQQDSLNVVGDPFRGNRYGYAGANPVTNIDPTGLAGFTNILFGVAIVAAVVVTVALTPPAAFTFATFAGTMLIIGAFAGEAAGGALIFYGGYECLVQHECF